MAGLPISHYYGATATDAGLRANTELPQIGDDGLASWVAQAHGQGQGFFYEQTNFNLTISNQVQTIIHRDLILPGTSSATADNSGRPGTGARSGAGDSGTAPGRIAGVALAHAIAP